MIPQYNDLIAAERLSRETERLARFTGAVEAYREGASLPRPWHFYEEVRCCPLPPLPSHVAGRFNTPDDRARRRARLIKFLARQCGRMVPDLTAEPRYAAALSVAIEQDIDTILTSAEYADTVQALDDADSDYEYLRLIPVWYVTWSMSSKGLPMPSVALKTRAQPVPYIRRTYVHSTRVFKTRGGDGFRDFDITSTSLAAMRQQQAQIDELSAQIDDLFN